MELREGYKNTEVGVIPEDWEVKCLDEIAESFQLGGNYPNNEIEGNNVLIKMANLGRGNVELSKKYFISSEIIPSEKDRVFYGDILFNTRNTLDLVGKVAIWRDELPRAYFNSNIMRIKFKEEEISSNFFMNLIFNTRNSIYQLRGIATGTTSVAAIYTRDLTKLLVPVPTKSEQTAIATALSDADALINRLSTLIAKKSNIKQGAMQQLLKPKEGWEVKKLGEIFTFHSTANYSKAEMDFDGEIGCMHYGLIHAISNTVYSLENGVKYFLKGNKTDYETIKDGDIIMVDASEDYDGINKSVEVFAVGNRKLIAGLHTYLMRDEKSLLVNSFRGLILNSTFVKNQLIKLAVGMKVYGVSKTQLTEVLIPVPPKEEQTRIATILSDMDAEIQALETKLEKYRKIKLGMMQNLLTGKIRLV